MDQTARLPLGGRRWQPYVKTLRFVGVDLTGATFAMDLREYRNAPGVPALALRTVTNGNAEGLRVVSVEQIDGKPVSIVSIKINESTMEALPFLGEAGSDSVLVYDIQIDRPGGYKAAWIEGEFWVLAAVTGADAADEGSVEAPDHCRPRPSFTAGPSTFQIGDSVISVEVGGGEGPPGQDGAPAPLPQEIVFTSVAGQTQYPLAGPLTDKSGAPFHPSVAVLEVVQDGVSFASGVDYSYASGASPVLFTPPLLADKQVTIRGIPIVATGDALSGLRFSIRKSMRDKLNEIIALDDVRTSDASDQDQLALADLLNSGYRQIRMRGGKGVGTTAGEYLWGVNPWKNPNLGSSNPEDYTEHPGSFTLANGKPAHGVRIMGDGAALSRIKQVDNYLLAHNSLSADVKDNLVGLAIENVTLEGLGGIVMPDGGANQNGHIVALAGVTHFRARGVRFLRQRADGVDAWMGPKPSGRRRNEDFGFDDCLWDGGGLPTRNGFSSEACVGWYVDRCGFMRMGYGTEPGAIDAEPIDAVGYANARGRVTNSWFQDLAYAAICFYLNNPDHYDERIGRYLAYGLDLLRCTRGIDLSGAATGELATVKGRHQVRVSNFAMRDVEQPLRSAGMVDARFSDGTLTDVGSVTLGLNNGKANQEVACERLQITRGGRTNGATFLIDDDTRNCEISDIDMVECGQKATTTGSGWGVLFRFGVAGLRLHDVRVTNEEGRMKAFAQVGDTASVGAGSQKYNNELLSGVAFTGTDNFNPPAPARGIVVRYVFAANTVIQSGTPRPFDVTVAGADKSKGWEVTWDFDLGAAIQAAGVLVDASTKELNVVRLTVLTGGSFDLSGRAVYIRERV